MDDTLSEEEREKSFSDGYKGINRGGYAHPPANAAGTSAMSKWAARFTEWERGENTRLREEYSKAYDALLETMTLEKAAYIMFDEAIAAGEAEGRYYTERLPVEAATTYLTTNRGKS